ncbi:hypothetical protein V5799_031475 [Amblyomma americanum]|uniref:Uncharacterized protein n=1 Tax=Amblyomma americanum TaxID=6943 RepID=A0AAQ4EKJ3_AMBAM
MVDAPNVGNDRGVSRDEILSYDDVLTRRRCTSSPSVPQAKTPVFDKVTGAIIQRKIKEWKRASARDNYSERQKGQTPDGHVTAAADTPLHQTRWKPHPQPRLVKQDVVILIKPKGILDLSKFTESNVVGSALHMAAGVVNGSAELSVWPVWEQNTIVVGVR